MRAINAPFKFDGGVMLAEEANSTLDQPTREISHAPESIYPLQQHIGRPAKPCVSIGERVFGGQIIARTQSARGANIVASVSGKVIAIEKRLTRYNSFDMCIVIQNDETNRIQNAWPELTHDDLPARIQARIKDSAIVGLGGARFPTASKLEATNIETIILNGIECEPYITCDQTLMTEHPYKVINGGRYALKATGAKQLWIAIRHDMPRVEKALTEALASYPDDDITLFTTSNVYPQGSERQLIQTLTGKRLKPHEHPQVLGLLMLNVGTAAQIANTCKRGLPMMRRRVTVTGDAIDTPTNVLVPLGTPVGHILNTLGVQHAETLDIIIGGPLSGQRIPDVSVPITKGTQAILVNHPLKHEPKPIRACINCGECERACPEHLAPQFLLDLAVAKDTDALNKHGLNACIECGCCDMVCPSRIPLTQSFREAKVLVLDEQQAHQHANKARADMLAKQARENDQKTITPPTAHTSSLAILDDGADAEDVVKQFTQSESDA